MYNCVCFFRLVNLVEYIQRPLVAGLDDRSSYVRKTAVIGCVKMHHIAPAIMRGNLQDYNDITSVLDYCIGGMQYVDY